VEESCGIERWRSSRYKERLQLAYFYLDMLGLGRDLGLELETIGLVARYVISFRCYKFSAEDNKKTLNNFHLPKNEIC